MTALWVWQAAFKKYGVEGSPRRLFYTAMLGIETRTIIIISPIGLTLTSALLYDEKSLHTKSYPVRVGLQRHVTFALLGIQRKISTSAIFMVFYVRSSRHAMYDPSERTKAKCDLGMKTFCPIILCSIVADVYAAEYF